MIVGTVVAGSNVATMLTHRALAARLARALCDSLDAPALLAFAPATDNAGVSLVPSNDAAEFDKRVQLVESEMRSVLQNPSFRRGSVFEAPFFAFLDPCRVPREEGHF